MPCYECSPSGETMFEVGDDLCLRVPDPVDPASPYLWSKVGSDLSQRVERIDCRSLWVPSLRQEDAGTYECLYNDGLKAVQVYSITITIAEAVPTSGSVVLALLVIGCALAGCLRAGPQPKMKPSGGGQTPTDR